uniref:Uncharacterized protein n=1 Tax=Arundo donax TaxID=35708 RepID=A0A0A9BRN6_ARUDO
MGMNYVHTIYTWDTSIYMNVKHMRKTSGHH